MEFAVATQVSGDLTVAKSTAQMTALETVHATVVSVFVMNNSLGMIAPLFVVQMTVTNGVNATWVNVSVSLGLKEVIVVPSCAQMTAAAMAPVTKTQVHAPARLTGWERIATYSFASLA